MTKRAADKYVRDNAKRLRPMRDGSVVEYDQPIFIHVEGVGEIANPDRVQVARHEPGSEIAAGAGRLRQNQWSSVDPVERAEAALRAQELAAEVFAAQGRDAEAERHRASAQIIKRQLNRSRRPSTASKSTAPRARGAGRPAARRAAGQRSGQDPGDGESDPESDPEGRRCRLPGCDRPATRKYCTREHGDVDRQRRHRAKSRSPKRLVRFSDHLVVEDGVDHHRQDPYLKFDTELWLPPEAPGRPRFPRIVGYEDLRLRAAAGCRCNDDHIAGPTEPHGVPCIKCGHWRPEVPA